MTVYSSVARLIDDSPLPLQYKSVLSIVRRFVNTIRKEKNVVRIDGKRCVVVGDIHGDFDALSSVYRRYGPPVSHVYVFLGDYVDRGSRSVQVVVTLMELSLMYPGCVVMLRGNHEFEDVNSRYGLMEECRRLYGDDGWGVFSSLNDAFTFLPLAAVLNGEYVCVHGGIPSSVSSIRDIESVCRSVRVSNKNKIIEGIMWSDPRDEVGYTSPSDRGAGEFFGGLKLASFLNKSGLEFLIRGHENVDGGIRVDIGDTLPMCVTIFLSPGDMLSDGCVLEIYPDGESRRGIIPPPFIDDSSCSSDCCVS